MRFLRKMHTLTDNGVPAFDKESDSIVRRRLVALQYMSDSDDGIADSGSGSAQTAILSAAASLGSAAIISQTSPNYVSAPQTARPIYGSSASPSSAVILVVVVVAIIAAIFAFGAK
jgi:hypothetical protein